MSINAATIYAILSGPEFDAAREQNRAHWIKWAHDMLARYQGRMSEMAAPPKVTPPIRNTDRIDWERVPDMNVLVWMWSNKTEIMINGHGSYMIEVAGKQYGPTWDYHLGCDTLAKFEAKRAAAPLLVLDDKKIAKYADEQWEQAQRFYSERVGEKLDIYLGRAPAAVTLDVTHDTDLVGRCCAASGDCSVVLLTSLKTNYRYGENSVNGSLTVYRQVPTLVESAKGFDPAVKDREHEAKIEADKRERKATIEAMQTHLALLERRKRCWDDLYGTLRFCAGTTAGVPANGNLYSVQANAKELGLTEVPSLAAAKAAVLELRGSIKGAKLALREARKPVKKEAVS